MKILLISNMYPSDENSFYGIFVKNINDYLKNNGYIIEKSVIKGKGKGSFDKIIKYLIFFLTTIVRYHKKYDLVYLHYISHSYIPLLLIQPIFKKKLVVHIHGGDILQEKNVNNIFFALKSFIAKKAIKNSYKIMVPSNYYKNVIINQFDVNSDKIFVYASGGVDLKEFYYKPVKNEEKFILGFVGRLDEGKGLEYLIESAYELEKYIPNLSIRVAGVGEKEKKYFKMVKDKNLENTIKFEGSVAHNKLVHFYNGLDLFIFPTERKSESLGLVGLEAMACGVPVIGSKIGGLEDYLEDKKNGLFFQVGNTKELTQKIFEFYKMSDEDKVKFRNYAIETANKYDSLTEGKRLINFFESLV